MYDIKGWDSQLNELQDFLTGVLSEYKSYSLDHSVPLRDIFINIYTGSIESGTYKYRIKRIYPITSNNIKRLDSIIYLNDGVTVPDVGIEIYYTNSYNKYKNLFTNSFFSIYSNIKETKRLFFTSIAVPFYRPNNNNKRNIEIFSYDFKTRHIKSLFIDNKIKISKNKYFLKNFKTNNLYSRYYAIGVNSVKLSAYNTYLPLYKIINQRVITTNIKTGHDDNGCIKSTEFFETLSPTNPKTLSFGNFENNNYEGCGLYI